MNERALFGRYWQADSPIHRLDPRTKVIGVLVWVVTCFCAGTFPALALLVVAACALIALSNIPAGQVLYSIAPLLFIVVLTAIFNLVFVQGGTVFVDFGWLQISESGVRMAVFVSIRLTLLLLGGSLLTLTTTSLDITEAFEHILGPFKRIGVPAHEFAMIMGIALRFLPAFAEEFHTIRAAQVSRGARLATSPTHSAIAGLTSLLVPLFASAFRHADTLAFAMDARCYHGSQGRTRLHELHFEHRDAIAAVALAVLLAGCIVISIISA